MTGVPGFSTLSREERLHYLLKEGLLSANEVKKLNNSGPKEILALSEKWVENFIGCYSLPMGIVPHFPMDEKKYTVPMVTEETSVIASVSKMAKWINQNGQVVTSLQGQDIIGQIQFPIVKDFEACQRKIESKTQALISRVNTQVVPNLVKRGGGVNHMTSRKVSRGDGRDMLVVHVYMHPCDAMGANLINQVCEYLREPLERLIDEKSNMCILSNLVDSKITESTVMLSLKNKKVMTMAQAEKITEASLFAKQDPYRAATHNKGIMNGIDAVLIATGNDFRAVEAGIHAFAARSGQYRGLSDWTIEDACLVGRIRAPVIVGTVGGVTKLHPMAQISLNILNIHQAEELSRLILTVGLVQNLAAMRALTQEGIVRGHMKLHSQNLLIAAGATPAEQEALKIVAEQFLQEKNKITQSDMVNLLQQWRNRDEK